jgi:hypothetical protein
MATERHKRAPRAASGDGDSTEVKPSDAVSPSSPNASDPADESGAATPNLNRAERRLEAKRKKGSRAATHVPQRSTTAPTNAMRRQGVKGLANSMKGTNTRRSG